MPELSTSRLLDRMPEAFVSDSTITRDVSRAAKAGRLRKLASRLYTRNMADPPEAVVARNLWSIVAGYFPGALVADRTALENAPAEDGSVCLVAESGSAIELPGYTLRPRRGAGPLPTDRPFVNGLFLSSAARAYLENMRPSRARNGRLRRTLSRAEVEGRLDRFVRLGGEEEANRLRGEVRTAARTLGLEREAAELDALIAAALHRNELPLAAPAAIARQQGSPFDPDRLDLFHALHAALRDYPPSARIAPERSAEAASTLAFFEAYFSNFIEGVEFSVEDAADIVFRGAVPEGRREDAQNVIGTWGVVSSDEEMRCTATDAASFEKLLRARHAAIMQGRTGMGPGAFKRAGNRAGATVFVAPDLVAGTLARGFEIGRSLESPFQRAAFTMFVVSEVHPFADGNGRVARVMANAELVAAGEERIVIPNVYRADYVAALRALSRTGRPEPLIRALDFAQRWTAAVDWRSIELAREELDACNAFLDPPAKERDDGRLRMPERIRA